MADIPQTGPRLVIERIYLRDLSFESPGAPAVFASHWRPQLQIDVNNHFSRLDDTRFEVVLTLTVEAKSGDTTLFVVELQQAGVFSVEKMDEPIRRQALSVACPDVLFPYARETIDQVVVKGTFPPLVLAPVNFDALYAEAQRQRKADQGDAVPS